MAENDQNALTAEEQVLLDSDAANSGTEAGPENGGAGTPAKPSAEAPAGTEAEGEDGKQGKQGTVSHAALHEERERRKQIERDLKTERESRQLLEQRTNLILERLTPKEPEKKEPAIPDINDDPAGHLAAVLQKTGKTLEQLVAESDAAKAQARTNEAVGSVISRAAALEREFLAVTPDYNDAGNHLAQSRNAELAAMGYSDPVQRNQIIQNEKLAIADQAIKQGRNPAEVVYAMAKLRGFTPKPGAPTSGAAPGKPAASDTDAEARAAAIKAGKDQGGSLTDTRGSGPRPLTAQRLLEMSEAEFAKMIDTPEGRAIMGA